VHAPVGAPRRVRLGACFSQLGLLRFKGSARGARRGHSFTRALLGLPAGELHVCGCPSAVPLLRRLVSETGVSHRVKTRCCVLACENTTD